MTVISDYIAKLDQEIVERVAAMVCDSPQAGRRWSKFAMTQTLIVGQQFAMSTSLPASLSRRNRMDDFIARLRQTFVVGEDGSLIRRISTSSNAKYRAMIAAAQEE